jgi:hypothetical protein
MTEQLWQEVLQRLAQAPARLLPTHCVSCWYEVQTIPFPAHDSSSLCARHAASTRKRCPVPVVACTIVGEVGAR